MSTEIEAIYGEEVAERESDDYSPYDYTEELKNPVIFDEQTLEEWNWE